MWKWGVSERDGHRNSLKTNSSFSFFFVFVFFFLKIKKKKSLMFHVNCLHRKQFA